MIHGETRIKLYNPLSGNIAKDIKSENTFQNEVVAKALRNLGECNASIMNNTTFKANDYWKETLGGILLFERTISSNTPFMPKGNRMRANAAVGITNSDPPSELGSYNSDSGITSDNKSLFLKYDWSTAQGNGDIACVCLTSKTGGFIGYGNPSGEYSSKFSASESYKPIRLIDYKFADSKGTNTQRQTIIVGNYKYRFTVSSHILTIYKTKVCITKGSILDGVTVKTMTFDLSEVGNPLNWQNEGCFVTQSEGKIYFLPTINQGPSQYDYYIAPGNPIRFYEFDPEEETVTLKSVNNNSTKSVTINSNPNYSYYRFGVSHGKLFCTSSGNPPDMSVEVFNISNNNHLSLPGVNQVLAQDLYLAGDLPGGLTWVANRNQNNYNNQLYVFDDQNVTAYPTNSNLYSLTNTLLSPFVWDEENESLICSMSNGVTSINNPMYLATINNLSAPVTKTTDLAMSVEYTLTEA